MNKDFRLFKRDESRREMPAGATGYKDRPYYFKFNYRGQTYLRCLETNLKEEAQQRAKSRYAEITSAVQSQQYQRVDATKLRQPGAAALADLIAAYRTSPAEADPQTRRQNINALLALAGSAVTLRDLTPALARQWFAAAAAKAAEQSDQPGANSVKRSANSRWTQATGLFVPKTLQHYRDLDLLDDPGAALITAWLSAGKAARFDKKKLKIIYRPPSDTILNATLKAWEQLTDRDLYLVIGHFLAFGLRKGEMIQARWTWHTRRSGYPVLDSENTPAESNNAPQVKNGTGLVQVRALDPWYSIMMNRVARENWRPSGDNKSNELIIAGGTTTYRIEDIYKSVSAWLRALGWKTQKTNHALRAYAGSQVAMKYGMYDACTWLRHSSVEVTQEHYSYFIKTFPVADKDQLPAKWSIAPTSTASPEEADPDRSTGPNTPIKPIRETASNLASGQTLLTNSLN